MVFTTPTIGGSELARHVGLLRAAFPIEGTWKNIWNIMREYNRGLSNSTGPPPLAHTWTEMEMTLTPTFQQTEITTSPNSPLSANPCEEAVKRFNHAVKLMIIFEHNSNNPKCQELVTWFTNNEARLGYREALKTIFLAKAFNERHNTVSELTGRTGNNFFSAWAELEVGVKYNEPLFPMSEGLTNAASPVKTDDWSIDQYTLNKVQWEINNPPPPGSMHHPRRGGHGWG
jgi:hypothetical protein